MTDGGYKVIKLVRPVFEARHYVIDMFKVPVARRH